MAQLTIYPEQYTNDTPGDVQTLTAKADVQNALEKIGVTYDVWAPEADYPADADNDTILKAFSGAIDQLKAKHGFKVADVIALKPDHPDKDTLRKKFLSEHTHSDDEARYFVDGKGLFYIHHENHVYGVLCEKGDLINVPAGLKHWFDMGPEPDFKCVRVFTDEAGWVASFTGDVIADRFPRMDNTK